MSGRRKFDAEGLEALFRRELLRLWFRYVTVIRPCDRWRSLVMTAHDRAAAELNDIVDDELEIEEQARSAADLIREAQADDDREAAPKGASDHRRDQTRRACKMTSIR
jgi:hypothetical protein